MVYKFACVGCNACYIGKMVQHFSMRVKEHLHVVSDRASLAFSNVIQNSEHCSTWCSADCFLVLDHASTSFQLKFSNSLIIHAALTQPEHLILVRWMGVETQ